MSTVTPTREWGAFIRAPDATDDGYLQCDIALEMHAQLAGHLRDTFPINQVPAELVDALAAVHQDAVALLKSSAAFGEAMVKACKQTPSDKPPMHLGYGKGSSFVGTMCGADGAMTKSNAEVTCPACKSIIHETADKDA